ncbi:MAG: hypothetical protein FJX56_08005 [Alphaproteobacteria bacterium]|nr:hypothetical protein [Alphaproteobacteria bacterium]
MSRVAAALAGGRRPLHIRAMLLPPRPHGVLIAALLAALLAGCGYALTSVVRDPVYTISEYRAAVSGKVVPVTIHGAPFPEGPTVAPVVLTALREATRSLEVALAPPARFSTAPADRAANAYHVVVVFNPASRTPTVCGPEAPPVGAPEGATVRFQLALCRDTQVASAARGVVEGVRGTDDRRFIAALARTARALFPQRDDDEAFRLFRD